MSSLEIYLHSKPINDGELFPLSYTLEQPTFNFNYGAGEYYTLVMVDPDAHADYPNRYYLHWMIINNNQIVVPFHHPSPPENTGVHRYYFYLFKQEKYLNHNDQPIGNRKNFDLKAFADKYHLKEITNIHFKTQYQKN